MSAPFVARTLIATAVTLSLTITAAFAADPTLDEAAKQRRFYEQARKASEEARRVVDEKSGELARLRRSLGDTAVTPAVASLTDQLRLERVRLAKLETRLTSTDSAYRQQKALREELGSELTRLQGGFDAEALARSMRALDEGDTTQAEALLEASVSRGQKQMKDAAAMRYQLALIKERERFDFAAAETLYADAIGLDPDNVTYLAAAAGNLTTLGKYDAAERAYGRALVTAQRVGAPAKDTARILMGLADLRWMLARFLDAEETFDRAAAQLKTSPRDTLLLARLYTHIGLNYWYLWRFPEAMQSMTRALDALAGRTDREGALARASVLSDAAGVTLDNGDPAQAERMYREAIALRQKHVANSDSDITIATYWNELGFLYRNRRRFAEAHALFGKSIAVFRRVFGAAHHTIAVTMQNQATTYCLEGRLDEAWPLATGARDMREMIYGGSHPQVADSLAVVGYLQRLKKDYDGAERAYRRSLAIREAMPPTSQLGTAKSLTLLGTLAAERGRHTRARELLERALAIEDGLALDRNPEFLAWRKHTLTSYAAVLRAEGRTDEAREAESRATSTTAGDIATCLR